MGSSLTLPVEYRRSFPHPYYSLEIQSFSSLSTLDKYKSDVFDAGGHKWSLSLYPKGDKDNSGLEHISFYLSMEKTANLPPGWEVHVNYNLFVYDKNQDKYRTIQDADGPVKKFHRLKTQWGFSRFLSLKEFEDPLYGYLVNDSCVFGADVFVIQPARKVESLKLIEFEPLDNTFTQQISNFSQLQDDAYTYPATACGRNWELRVHPKGIGTENGKSLSVYLEALEIPPERKLFAKFKLRLLNRFNRNHKEEQFSHWLSASEPSKGCLAFIPLQDLQNQKKGFISDDALTVEVQILAISTVEVDETVNSRTM